MENIIYSAKNPNDTTCSNTLPVPNNGILKVTLPVPNDGIFKVDRVALPKNTRSPCLVLEDEVIHDVSSLSETPASSPRINILSNILLNTVRKSPTHPPNIEITQKIDVQRQFTSPISKNKEVDQPESAVKDKKIKIKPTIKKTKTSRITRKTTKNPNKKKMCNTHTVEKSQKKQTGSVEDSEPPCSEDIENTQNSTSRSPTAQLVVLIDKMDMKTMEALCLKQKIKIINQDNNERTDIELPPSRAVEVDNTSTELTENTDTESLDDIVIIKDRFFPENTNFVPQIISLEPLLEPEELAEIDPESCKTDSQDTSQSSSTSSKSATNNDASEVLKTIPSTSIVPKIMENIIYSAKNPNDTTCSNTLPVPNNGILKVTLPVPNDGIFKVDRVALPKNTRSPCLVLEDEVIHDVSSLSETPASSPRINILSNILLNTVRKSPTHPPNIEITQKIDVQRQIDNVSKRSVPKLKPIENKLTDKEDIETLTTQSLNADKNKVIVITGKKDNQNITLVSTPGKNKNRDDNTNSALPSGGRPVRMKRKPEKFNFSPILDVKKIRHSNSESQKDSQEPCTQPEITVVDDVNDNNKDDNATNKANDSNLAKNKGLTNKLTKLSLDCTVINEGTKEPNVVTPSVNKVTKSKDSQKITTNLVQKKTSHAKFESFTSPLSKNKEVDQPESAVKDKKIKIKPTIKKTKTSRITRKTTKNPNKKKMCNTHTVEKSQKKQTGSVEDSEPPCPEDIENTQNSTSRSPTAQLVVLIDKMDMKTMEALCLKQKIKIINQDNNERTDIELPPSRAVEVDNTSTELTENTDTESLDDIVIIKDRFLPENTNFVPQIISLEPLLEPEELDEIDPESCKTDSQDTSQSSSTSSKSATNNDASEVLKTIPSTSIVPNIMENIIYSAKNPNDTTCSNKLPVPNNGILKVTLPVPNDGIFKVDRVALPKNTRSPCLVLEDEVIHDVSSLSETPASSPRINILSNILLNTVWKSPTHPPNIEITQKIDVQPEELAEMDTLLNYPENIIKMEEYDQHPGDLLRAPTSSVNDLDAENITLDITQSFPEAAIANIDDVNDLSSIKFQSPERQEKSPSPGTSSDYFKLTSPVHSNGEPFENVSSPEFFTENKLSPDKRDASPPRAEIAATDATPSSSLSLKENQLQTRHGYRASQILLAVNSNGKIQVLERVEPEKISKRANTPARRNSTAAQNTDSSAHFNVEDDEEYSFNLEEDEEDEEYLNKRTNTPARRNSTVAQDTDSSAHFNVEDDEEYSFNLEEDEEDEEYLNKRTNTPARRNSTVAQNTDSSAHFNVEDDEEYSFNLEEDEEDEEYLNKPANTPARRNSTAAQNTASSADFNLEEDEEYLNLQRVLPTLTSSPGPILKRKLIDFTDEATSSFASKRNRVCYHDPPISNSVFVQNYLRERYVGIETDVAQITPTEIETVVEPAITPTEIETVVEPAITPTEIETVVEPAITPTEIETVVEPAITPTEIETVVEPAITPTEIETVVEPAITPTEIETVVEPAITPTEIETVVEPAITPTEIETVVEPAVPASTLTEDVCVAHTSDESLCLAGDSTQKLGENRDEDSIKTAMEKLPTEDMLELLIKKSKNSATFVLNTNKNLSNDAAEDERSNAGFSLLKDWLCKNFENTDLQLLCIELPHNIDDELK